MVVASAEQSAHAAFQLLSRREPARLWPAAAGSRLRTTIRTMACSTERRRACGSNRRRLGQGARCSSPEIPTADETFDNIVAFWNPADTGQRRRRAAVRLSHVLGHEDARVLESCRSGGNAHWPRWCRGTAAPIFLVALCELISEAASSRRCSLARRRSSRHQRVREAKSKSLQRARSGRSTVFARCSM